MIKIGVIGAGNMGKNHIRTLKKLNDKFDFIGFYDENIENKEKVEKMFNIYGFSNIDDLLNKVEAVIIATPSITHKEIGMLVAENHIHSLIEKPLALDFDDATYLVDLYKSKNLKLMVGHVERYNPVISELIKVLKDQKILAIEARRCSPFDNRALDSSVIDDLMIHDIDLVFNKLYKKDIESVFAQGLNTKSDKLDYVNALFKFEDGVVASLISSRVTENKIRTIEIHTEEKYIKADMLNKTLTATKQVKYNINQQNAYSYTQQSITENYMVPQDEPLLVELTNFYNGLNNGVNECPGEDGANAVKIAKQVSEISTNNN